MNKAELAKAIKDESKYQITQDCAEDMIKCFIDIIEKNVAIGEKVQLVGFGTFEKAHRAERDGKNPQTGAPLTIAACNVPKFKPGKAFKDAVNVK